MNAPTMYVPLRGGAVKVEFRERGLTADWWFVHDPGLRLSEDELERIQQVVDAEVRHLQKPWRDAADLKRRIRVIAGSRHGGDAA
jgi:hypothetical protein